VVKGQRLTMGKDMHAFLLENLKVGLFSLTWTFVPTHTDKVMRVYIFRETYSCWFGRGMIVFSYENVCTHTYIQSTCHA
jgi:hypothetical protein